MLPVSKGEIMSKEHVIYGRTWLRDKMKIFYRDTARSVAFGLVMFVSSILLLVPVYILIEADQIHDVEPAVSVLGFIVLLVICIPLCILGWWGALEIADDSHWEKPVPTIWEDQKAHMLESTLHLAKRLESQGKKIDMSIVLSDDIYSEAHKFIEETDESTLRLYMAALLASRSMQMVPRECVDAKGSHYLQQPLIDADIKTEDVDRDMTEGEYLQQ